MKYIQPDWPAPHAIKAFTTLRQGWGGRHAQPIEESNHLESLLHLPERPIWLKQTHSTRVVQALPEKDEPEADASYTTETNRICVVLTADCLPILICNTEGTQVAAIHAGWRGLAGGIIENTINVFNEPGPNLLVWLGPAIGPQQFEVGIDVYDTFTQKHAESAAAFLPHTEGKWLANLYELAKIRLKLLNVEQIYGGNFCTFSQKELFFSYRRDQGKTGRMASLIWIEGN